MPAENRLNIAGSALQRLFSRLAARIALLTFWQFALLAVIVLAAAAITEDLLGDSRFYIFEVMEKIYDARYK